MINESLKGKQWVEDLVANRVPEGRLLDYKQSLADDSPASKVNFLSDVAAFANASGGELVFGIEEELIEGKRTGIPKDYVDLKIKSADETTRRLQDLIRRGIEPSLSVQIDAIGGLPKGPVIRVSVPASWAAPHMVTLYQKDLLKPQFYKRHNAENLPMDVDEIRSAFTIAESRIERLRRFRQDRVGRLVGQDPLLPQIYSKGPKVILHLLPINASESSTAVNIKAVKNLKLDDYLGFASVRQPARMTRIDFNFDGFLAKCFSRAFSEAEPIHTVQIFRSGAVEAVRTLLTETHIESNFEVDTLRYARGYLALQRELGAPLPIVVMLTLWGAKGLPVANSRKQIDRDPLLLAEGLLDDWGASLAEILRPAFDMLYQDVGSIGSPNYSAIGEWTGGDVSKPPTEHF